jgi:AcrR family transcriptional regulator
MSYEPLSGTAAGLRAVDGRVPGRRGLATRRRLLDTLREMLETTPYRDLKVVDVARAAGTSPATFYQYFPQVESAVLALAEELADGGGRELRELVAGQPWSGDGSATTMLNVADGFLSFWERHRALLSVIDLAALDGDRRFRELRTRLLHGVNEALADAVGEAAAAGRLPEGTDPRAVASVLTSMLAHVAAHRRGLEDHGVSVVQLRTTMARILGWAGSGEAPALPLAAGGDARGDAAGDAAGSPLPR